MELGGILKCQFTNIIVGNVTTNLKNWSSILLRKSLALNAKVKK
jgi:hypothetical protein